MVSERKSAALAVAIENFLAECQLPALLERGAAPLALLQDHFRLEVGHKGLWLEAWDEQRLWSRRILDVKQPARKRLELEAFRFGKKPIRVSLVDAADGRSSSALEKTHRSVFAERFSLFLNRHFGSWRLEEYRWEADLENSQSPLYPTALFTRGQEAVAALGAPPRDTSFHALTFALIYLDLVRKRHGAICASRLLLYLPEEHAAPVIALARRLEPSLLSVDIWLYSADGHERLLDPADSGNLLSRLSLRASRLAGPAWWLDLLAQFPQLETLEESGGALSYTIRGYEVARLVPASPQQLPTLYWGPRLRHRLHNLATPEECSSLLAYFAQVDALRHPASPHRQDPLFTSSPERWLESSVRANLTEIDPTLTGEVYREVLSTEAGDHGRPDHGRADLLALTQSGRLVLLELKATEDIHLPLQAFGYWLRIRQHLLAGDFASHGYFRGTELSRQAPKLYLVAPALHFHPTTQGILSFLPKECPAQIIGLGGDWRQRADVALRM
ncbi:MAG: hypothetical protein NW208_10110 [Bryobacter sp.]|nr:hypothetical protein [Bryobacter sp.]